MNRGFSERRPSDEAPNGQGIAAFFDIDGTLLPPPSLERRFIRYLRWRGELSVTHAARWLGAFLQLLWRGLCDDVASASGHWMAATEGNKAHLVGLRAATLDAFLIRLGRQPLHIYPEGLRRLEWHAVQRHRIFLLSGTLQPLAELVARRLTQPLATRVTAYATALEVVEGRWTGRVLGAFGENSGALCGPAKARALHQLVAEYGLDLKRSHAYGNSWSDHWMLERVGHPVPTNPSPRLARLARSRGWPVLRWRQAALDSENPESIVPSPFPNAARAENGK